MKISYKYQIALIVLALITAAMLSVFVYREVFPQYKEFQSIYVELEEFRESYTGDSAPDFSKGVKQIVIPQAEHGPELINRCVSCHVALKFEHFSPTKIAHDVNGNIIFDDRGRPVQVENEEYIWAKLEDKIASLRDEETNTILKQEGKESEVAKRLDEATKLEALTHGVFDDISVKLDKVLQMHPLMGRETRPFELHPSEEYACTVCHSGNGRGLTLKTAHGPIYDKLYHAEDMGHETVFLEIDDKNDPSFSKVFNHKPGHELLFQTKPVFVGSLMQATCVQCHQDAKSELQGIIEVADAVAEKKQHQTAMVDKGFHYEESAVISLIGMKNSLNAIGYQGSVDLLTNELSNPLYTDEQLDQSASLLRFLQREETKEKALAKIQEELFSAIGSDDLLAELEEKIASSAMATSKIVSLFVKRQLDSKKALGTLFTKARVKSLADKAQQRLSIAKAPISVLKDDPLFVDQFHSDADLMMLDYQRGKELFFSNACYACHTIDLLSRGSVGPDLTTIGLKYPWYVKEAIVWPQSNLKTSTMPNFKMDHEELADVMTFLMAQRDGDKVKSSVQKTVVLKEWLAGKKLPWEQAIPPTQMTDVNAAMKTFAVEGCAACHRLKGFEGSTGFSSEKGRPGNKKLSEDKKWFYELFPENILGSDIVTKLDEHAEEIDARIQSDVKKEGVLNEIEEKHPNTIEGFYTNFKFAERAKNALYSKLLGEDSASAEKMLSTWKNRVERVRQIFIQEYGLGREIGPRLNWAGIYRDNEWLYGHFKSPGAYAAKSIMPVMPFDDSKLFSLMNMLQVLGEKNRDDLRVYWDETGFDPQQAYQIYCSSCHGTYRHGDGPVAEWIYPIPKNLRSGTFLRNLTKERVVNSITYGVQGTPMPPWGSAADNFGHTKQSPVLRSSEIEQLADWIFSQLPGARIIKSDTDVPKWHYDPSDVLREMEEEGNFLEENPNDKQVSALNIASLELPTFLSAGLSLGKSKDLKVKDFFRVEESKEVDVDKKRYYIKEAFYTPENIAEGEKVFLLNCAQCHGKEAAGNGNRSETMTESKPRMLTNLPWLRTRDDLRLLRSIKFGVPGTAMTPWGDKIDVVQRMQAVIFIRSLVREKSQHSDLNTALYRAFSTREEVIDGFRVMEYANLEKAQVKYAEARDKHAALYTKFQNRKEPIKDVSDAYKKELRLLKSMQKQESVDDIVQRLLLEQKRERSFYEKVGLTIITQKLKSQVLKKYLKLITLEEGVYRITNGTLLRRDTGRSDKRKKYEKAVLESIASLIEVLEDEIKKAQGQLRSAKRTDKLEALNTRLLSLKDLQGKVMLNMEQAEQSRAKQKESYYRLGRMLRTLNKDKNTTQVSS